MNHECFDMNWIFGYPPPGLWRGRGGRRGCGGARDKALNSQGKLVKLDGQFSSKENCALWAMGSAVFTGLGFGRQFSPGLAGGKIVVEI
jgi:hypothetical protein